MHDFDPELYLRLIGERELASGLDLRHQRINGRAELPAAAAALAVAGVIDEDLAQRISADYDLAGALRAGTGKGPRMIGPGQMAATASLTPLAPRTVFVLAATVPLPDATVHAHALTLTESGARLTCEVAWVAVGGRNRPPDLNVRTPAGQRLTGGFGGGWSDRSANGHYDFDGALDPDMAWIEIDGTRVDLPPPAPPPPVAIEALETERLQMRYLWQLLANFGDRHGQGGRVVGFAAEALIAAGQLAEDDPELEAVRWASGQGVGNHPHLRAVSAMGAAASPGGVPEPTPPEWKSLLAGTRTAPGPTGTVAVGAVTPVFDGISVAVNELSSGPSAFSVTAETVGVAYPHPMGEITMRAPLAWWARDDRGNHYLGHAGNWSGGGGNSGMGEISFGPLDPQAAELTLAVTTLTRRALIPVPLAWGDVT
jgi:hypothetical protein